MFLIVTLPISSSHVATICSSLLDILREVTEDLIEVDPGIIMSLTKGLYLVNPGF